MRVARRRAVLVIAVFLPAMLLVPSDASIARASASRNTGIGLIKLGGPLGPSSNRSRSTRYSVVIVGQASAHRAARLPGRSLLYGCGVNIPDANWSGTCGVSWTTAAANNWLLKDANGNYVPYGDGYSYLADVGNRSYQRAWISALTSILASDPGIDGVMIDNVTGSLIAPSAAYPDDASYRAAMKSFVDAVGKGLRAKGRYVAVNASMFDGATANWRELYGNTCDGSQTLWWFQQLAPDVNGFVNEYWEMNWDSSGSIRLSGTAACNQNWDGWQRLVGAVQRMGKDFIPLTSGSSDATGLSNSTFLKASFLLDYNGGTSAFIYSAGGLGSYSTQVDDSVGDAAWKLDIGQPVGRKYRVGVGWRRDFTRGTVIIDPSPSISQRFALRRTYSLPGGRSATSVALAPGTALILPRRPRS
jgi:hypothetical protein